MIQIDFGCGYNPKKGYKSCDITNSPILDYLYVIEEDCIECLELKSVDEFYLRNVVHHIPDIEKTFNVLKKYLCSGGKITIIDVRKEYFLKNVILDIIWYRYIIPRYEIWIGRKYRDYKSILTKLGLKMLNSYVESEKEISVWQNIS